MSDPEVSLEPAYAAALEHLRPRLAAMAEGDVDRTLRLDAREAADIAEAGAEKVVPHRGALVAVFGAIAGVLVDTLPTVARGTKQADVEHVRTDTSADVSPMHDEVRRHYGLLMTDAESLANRGKVDPRELEPARDIQGYQALLRAVLVLVSLFREKWSSISSHTPVTVEMIDAAERSAQGMSRTLLRRDHGVDRVPAAELRARAVTALVHDYDEVRRMMTYLRWHEGDVDAIVPSLWAAGRSPRKRADEEPAPVAPGAPAPGTPGSPFTS